MCSIEYPHPGKAFTRHPPPILARMHFSGEGGGVGARNRYHLSFWRFFPSFIALWAQLGGNPCSEASCGVVTFSLVLKAFQVVLGSRNPEFTICPFRARIWPFQAPKTQAKNTIKQGKDAKKTNGTHFTHVQGGGVYILKPPAAGIVCPPPFIRSPPLEGYLRAGRGGHSPFANSYLPITYFLLRIN